MQELKQISFSELQEIIAATLAGYTTLSENLANHREVLSTYKGKLSYQLVPSENTIEAQEVINQLRDEVLLIQEQNETLILYAASREGRDNPAVVKEAKKYLQSCDNHLKDKLADINATLQESIVDKTKISDSQLKLIQEISTREQTPPTPEPVLTETNIGEPAAKQEAPVIPPSAELKANQGTTSDVASQKKTELESPTVPLQEPVQEIPATTSFTHQQHTKTSKAEKYDESSSEEDSFDYKKEQEIKYDERNTEAIKQEKEEGSSKAWTIAGLTVSESLAVGAIIGGAILMATGPIGLAVGGALMLGGIIGGAVAGVIGFSNLFGGDENKSSAQPTESHQQQDGPTSDPSIGRTSSFQETVAMAKELKQHINIDMSSTDFGNPETPGKPKHQSLQQHRVDLTSQQKEQTETPKSDTTPQQLNK